ncbi:MAG: NAD-dependent epimerase/dehydratase family protein [Alphaproteobacteria bacterium]|nr:NAD-dependent epimerase/dehydratase family protein [Alphaproteobacteria bacterium]
MTTLVTGGTGFIGSRLALDCAKRGEAVRILAKINNANERSGHDELKSAGIQIIDGDICDPATAGDAMKGVKTLYHLAAAQHEANVGDDYFRRINVEGTRTILDAAVDAKVKRVVHGSTIGVYGMADEGPVHDRTPLFPDNIYGQTKLEGEHLARSYADRLKLAIVRISESYGPGDYRLLKLFKGIKSKKFFMVGKGANLHHPIFIDDLIEGLRRAATDNKAIGETVVLAGPTPVSTREMVDGISKALDTAGPKITVPLPALMGAAMVIETVCRPVGIQPPLHRRRMNFFVKSFKFSGDGAREKLGFEPVVGFDEGAKRTAKWYEETGLL